MEEEWQKPERPSEEYKWLYAVWMAFLADEETHELQQVLRNLSEWMTERTLEEDWQDAIEEVDMEWHAERGEG